MIRLMVGLGNPGAQYQFTRHNAGFWWMDQVSRHFKVSLVPHAGYFGLAARATTPAGTLWLLQPMTFMNLSGKSVGALANFFKIEPQNILVAHDELDLSPGEMKLKVGGGHAGHNGLRDIHAQLSSPEYWRLRLGIGHPGIKSEVANYVLSKPPAAHKQAIEACIERSIQALDALCAGQIEPARRIIHTKPGIAP